MAKTISEHRAEALGNRIAKRIAFLKEIHEASKAVTLVGWESTGIADAKERLKRPKRTKGEYTPPRPADHVTAFLVSPVPPVKEHGNAKCRKQRNHVAAHTKATKKSWGKAGHQFSNKLLRSRAEAQKFLDDKAYAS